MATDERTQGDDVELYHTEDDLIDVDTAKQPDIQVGLLAKRMPVTVWVEDYYWTCQVCGWLGTGLSSIDAAQAEAVAHFRADHEPREVYIVRRDQKRP